MRGRDEPLERPTDGQGVLASASHNACAEDIGRHVPLCAELRCPKAIVGRTRCPIVGACVAAKARWPSLLHSRDCPHPPAPSRCLGTLAVLVPLQKLPAHPSLLRWVLAEALTGL